MNEPMILVVLVVLGAAYCVLRVAATPLPLCDWCDGTGVQPVPQVEGEALVLAEETCWQCEGVGVLQGASDGKQVSA